MSVSEPTLQKLLQSGQDSPFLRARLQYTEAANLLNQHISRLAGLARVYPNMMTPQSSGRVGISNPPLGNFTPDPKYGPHGLRDVIRPDPGTKWICPDWNAVEMELVCHRGKAPNNDEIRRLGLDRHTVNAIRTFRYPDPPLQPTKAWLKSSDGLSWREQCGFTEPLRTLIKNCQYTLQYAHGDLYGRAAERALGVYAVKMALEKSYLYRIGAQFLKDNPWLVAFKRRRWEDAWRLKESRTSFGRRRRLFGARVQVETEGLNHEIQGTVADLLKQTQVALAEQLGCRMVLQRHDGWYSEVPEDFQDFDRYLAIVQREWIIDDRPIAFTAEYEVWHA